MEHPVWSFLTRDNGVNLSNDLMINPLLTPPQSTSREFSEQDRKEYAEILTELPNLDWFTLFILGQWP